MVSRTAAEDAVRSVVKGPELGDLLFFIGEQTDEQLSQWSILDADGNSAIVAFVRRKAQAAGVGTTSTAAVGGPDTSEAYIRRVLIKPKPWGATDVSPTWGLLDQPLGAKLPLYGAPAQVAWLSSSAVQHYAVVQPLDELAANAHELRLMTTAALTGITTHRGGSEDVNSSRIRLLVDFPLEVAADSLGLHHKVNRNTTDESSVTARQLRPSFLFWVSNVLLFKGEEKKYASQLEGAKTELKKKMATPWSPAQLPGVSMPVMFAYAAAGSLMQFLAITTRPGGAVEMEPLSGCLDISQPIGRIRVVHYTLKILEMLAAYAPHAPGVTMPVGRMMRVVGASGNFMGSLEMFPDFVRKCVNLSAQSGRLMDYTAFVEMYTAIAPVRCPNLIRLHGGGTTLHGGNASLHGSSSIRLRHDGTTMVLHLSPVGVPQSRPPKDEANLKQAVGDVLTGLAALHAAGFVHRDIQWRNVIWLPPAPQSSPAGSLGTYVLIDLEHAARADCTVDFRESELRLNSWPHDGILDPDTGRYTRQSDLCLLAVQLMVNLPFALSHSGQQLRLSLTNRQVTSAEAALLHPWLAM